jgi:hypothetical protein
MTTSHGWDIHVMACVIVHMPLEIKSCMLYSTYQYLIGHMGLDVEVVVDNCKQCQPITLHVSKFDLLK